MSFSTILSSAVDGLQAELIRVEADVSNGLPVFHMVGYLSSEVREAGERVRTAIRNSGYEYPPKRTVVNLSPATVRKRGASFDLPIAAAILTALGQIPPGSAKDCLMIGNDEAEDMAAATAAGLSGYLVTDCRISSQAHPWKGAQGSFAELTDALEHGFATK